MEPELRQTTHPESPLRVRVLPKRGVPALLVSVRNAAESVAALKGGCDVLDVKDPSRGPLGMATVEEIRAIVAARDAVSCSIPISVALGELQDWSEAAPVLRLGLGISFVKFGTSRLPGNSDLCQRFQRLCSRWIAPPGLDGSRETPRGCIAVAYADWQAAQAPHPCAVAEATVSSGCEGLLIDTFCKAGGGLFENIPVAELNECASIVRRAGRTFALAGRLGLHDIERALELGPDLLGIRSAACRDSRRDLDIDANSVEQFRRAMTRAAARLRATLEAATAEGQV